MVSCVDLGGGSAPVGWLMDDVNLHVPRRVHVEVPWRRAAVRHHVREEPQGADLVERIGGNGEDIAADDRRRCFLGLLWWLWSAWSAWMMMVV
jgi:hypothetical protein